ncbi:MAG: bifunctional folylpolyglutamate synthase/dihydrofolate synthase [Propionibacteriaceae bacterium]|nr:bifunctional folylpolyglutamate synthase/dihydrofolate synthase [Propionibacteriaceae bacterium]
MSRHERVSAELTRRWPEHRVARSLRRIQALIELLDDPQRTAPVVQITGTNGKGSTAIMIDALLRAAGLRTGRFTSPHLNNITERICIDGEPISDDEFDDLWSRLKPYVELVDGMAIDGVPMTFFEVMTALAYLAFADTPVDVMVIEVGMGGSWDATSVADAEVAVIAPIDLDHTQLLGGTIAEIAAEKAGIIKWGTTAVIARQQPEALEVLLARCEAENAEALLEGEDFSLFGRTNAIGGQVVSVSSGDTDHRGVFLPLYGAHMAHNAALAVSAVEALLGRPLPDDVIADAFDAVHAPARLELVSADPPVVLDTAHNPHGVAATLAAFAEAFQVRPVTVLLGMMRDKAVDEVLRLIEPLAAHLVCTQASGTDRALPAVELADMAAAVFGPARVEAIRDASEALEAALDQAAVSEGGVLVLGSVYLAGEVRALLGR